ncbi:MAG TPA: UDP-glucose 4-epimerase [Firmicutes bacterium]|jgi:UDP-glucose 4-epimerase|nr:UDP-glucose 4-epimerase [Bacillota bacterium]
MSKILVTGGAGFIGSNLVEELLPLHQVSVVDNLSSGKRSQVLNGAGFYEADILEKDFLKIVAQVMPDYIIHLAAQVNVATSLNQPFRDLELNILGSLKVMEAARLYGVKKIIYPSSAAVYGNPQFLPITEEHPVMPMSLYGISKHTPEHYFQVYSATYGLRYSVLRFANVYGPRQDSGGEGGVVAIFADRLLKNEPIQIFGDGEQTRDFVFVKDVVQAITQAMISGDNQIYNIGSGQKVSINGLLHELQILTGSNTEAEFLPARPGDIRHSLFDISKAKSSLHWMPKNDLNTGLSTTIEWFQRTRL